jgi:predicted PurR-regulated permease PerM
VALLAVLLIAATGLLIPRFIGEAVAGFTDLRTRIESGAWDAALQRHPWVASLWGWLQARIDLHDAFNRVAALLASAGSIAVRWSLTATVELVLTLFFLHYFLRDRERLLDGLRALLPTTADETNRLLAAARATVLATVYGKVLIGIVQGALGGLMFWWLDLPAPWFWAIVMGVLSIAPLVGAPLVWLPAALLLLAQGHWLQALILTAWGALVVGLADNVLYPIVVGRYLQLHTVLLVVAMIGGLFVFGSAGFFLGPVLLAVTAMMLQIWRERGRAGAG